MKWGSKVYDSIIIGCGFAGAVIARELAEKNNKKVLIIEQRDHIGGNCYDTEDEYGILIHSYGPHIFHTNDKKVYEFLSRFTKWYNYSHEVVGAVNGKELPIPFNLNTLNLVYGESEGKKLTDKLVGTYGMNSRVPILDLMNNEDEDIKAIAKFVYKNIFLKYTMKQWGQTPQEIDPAVMSRVPVLISYDNRYFQDEYQGMPLEGYTALFRNMLNHDNITVQLNRNAKDIIQFSDQKNQEGKATLLFEGNPFEGDVIYTGPIEELFDGEYGQLPYRSLRFEYKHYDQDYVQSHAVVNYTVSEKYTRITEFKYLTNQIAPKSTTIMREYPIAYTGQNGEIPYYAIVNEENQRLYQKYVTKLEGLNKFHLLGRLAEYKYYNIDGIVARALDLAKHLDDR